MTDQIRPLAGVLNSEGISRDVIVIGASAGGVDALARLFCLLPRELPATIGCVLHRGTTASRLAQILSQHSSLPIREPQTGESVQQGMIYLAPPDRHLLFTPQGIALSRESLEHGTRPAVDPLFRSTAATYGERVLGVLLTGASQDGLRGMMAVAQSGGLTVVQDPDDAYLPYMALHAIRGDQVKGIYPLDDLPAVFATLAGGGTVESTGEKRTQP
jgi:two-component system chemotaxis response regulator CheB